MLSYVTLCAFTGLYLCVFMRPNGYIGRLSRLSIMYVFYTMSLSMALLTVWMRLESSLFSLVVMLAEITGLETPQARPRAALEETKTYETFLIT